MRREHRHNQLIVATFDDDTSSLSKRVLPHPLGEIWHLAASHSNGSLFSSVFSERNEAGACIWRLPNDDPADPSDPDHQLELVNRLKHSDISAVLWEPTTTTQSQKLASIHGSLVSIVDLAESSLRPIAEYDAQTAAARRHQIGACRWSMHHSASLIALASADGSLCGVDLRSLEQCFRLVQPTTIRSIDFNPNKPHDIATAGDDCAISIWDTRKLVRNDDAGSALVKSIHEHSWWVWSCRYNPFHDQLLLSSSSDARVVLHSVGSISSEPMRIEGDDASSSTLQDGVVCVREEHEDSVYAAEWSHADPWIYASISYDGRLVVNRVPRAVKYQILL